MGTVKTIHENMKGGPYIVATCYCVFDILTKTFMFLSLLPLINIISRSAGDPL